MEQVTHSELGLETLKRFLLDIGGISPDWKLQDVLTEQIELVKSMVGPDDYAICALSGGVDSTVAATIVHRAIGDRLFCCFVDNGLMRLVFKSQNSRMTRMVFSCDVQ